MRQPSTLEDPEMVPVDIVAESGPPTLPSVGDAEPESAATAAVAMLNPVIVGAVMIPDPAAAAAVAAAAAAVTSPPSHADAGSAKEGKGQCLRAWAVESPTGMNGADENVKFPDVDSETGLVSAPAAAAAAAADAATAVVPPASPSDVLNVNISAAAAAAAGSSGGHEHGISSFGDYMVGEDVDENCDVEFSAGAGAADIDDADTTVARTEVSSSWDSSTTEGEEDSEGNVVRARRSISNLETARRMGAGLDSEIMSDDTDSGSDGLVEEVEADVVRPRALSLDGWFTCRLEKGRPLRSYDTHDHAGRLRDLVKLVRHM